MQKKIIFDTLFPKFCCLLILKAPFSPSTIHFDCPGPGSKNSNKETPLPLDKFQTMDLFLFGMGPLDILHDVFEGIIPQDLLGIIRILANNGQFSITDYNSALHRLGFLSYESNDKPCPVPTSPKVKHLKGKAVSQWVHLRNWPLVVKSLLSDYEDSALTLGLLLHEIVERLTANEYLPYEIDILEDKIEQYLDLRSVVRADYPSFMPNPKPKHHFLR